MYFLLLNFLLSISAQASVLCDSAWEEIKHHADYSTYEITPRESSLEGRAFKMSFDVEKAVSNRAKQLGIPEKLVNDASDNAAFIAKELYENAGRWGNVFDNRKKIGVKVRAEKDGILIMVSDQSGKPFTPLTDPGGVRDGEDYGEFEKRRLQMGKPLTADTEGLFWSIVRGKGYAVTSRFDEGNSVAIKIPWDATYP